MESEIKGKGLKDPMLTVPMLNPSVPAKSQHKKLPSHIVYDD